MSKKISVINGSNLNMLGRREKNIYGNLSLDDINKRITDKFHGRAEIIFFQSNHEGSVIDYIHSLPQTGVKCIVINAAAWTHTSIAIRDALLSISLPFIEVHISNVYRREEFRKLSFLSDCAEGVITGLGIQGYEFAVQYFIDKMEAK